MWILTFWNFKSKYKCSIKIGTRTTQGMHEYFEILKTMNEQLIGKSLDFLTYNVLLQINTRLMTKNKIGKTPNIQDTRKYILKCANVLKFFFMIYIFNNVLFISNWTIYAHTRSFFPGNRNRNITD